MLLEYLKLSNLARSMAYIVFRDGKEKGVTYKEIEKRFERFGEKAIKSNLDKLTTEKPQFLVCNGETYRASEELVNTLTNLDVQFAIQRQRTVV